MSEISFIREQDRSRLVIPVSEAQGYALRMMEKRSFTGLMPVEILSLNGDTYCCYDVSGSVSLENRYRLHKPGREDIDGLFEGYASSCSELEDYLMDASGIMLDPCYVFYDMGNESYRFILDPSGNAGGIRELLTFLADNVDPGDEEAVSEVYRLCEMGMTDENFSLLPALESMNRKAGREAGSALSGSVPSDNNPSLFGETFEPGDFEEEQEVNEEASVDSTLSRIYLASAVIGILGLIGAAALYMTFEMSAEELCVTAACAAVMLAVTAYSLKMMEGQKKEKTGKKERPKGKQKKTRSRKAPGENEITEEILKETPEDGIGEAVSTREKSLAGNNKKCISGHDKNPVEDNRESRPGEDKCPAEESKESLSGFDLKQGEENKESQSGYDDLEERGRKAAAAAGRSHRKRFSDRFIKKDNMKETLADEREYGMEPKEGDAGFPGNGDDTWEIKQEGNAELTGKGGDRDPYRDYAMEERTVLFTDNKAPEEFKLYSLAGDRLSIGLEKLPAIVGKIRGLSDIVLPDASVSRLHARLDKEDGRVTVMDLDSTNGTFINGKRLMPNETAFLQSGDELRIGALDFCLR